MPQSTNNGLIAVAISLDDAAPLLEAAGQLALKSNMGLHLIHIAQPPFVGLTKSLVNLDFIAGDTLRLIEAESLMNAESKLRELSRSLPTGVSCSTKVIVNRSISEAVLAEATVVGSKLLMCAAGKGNYSYMPRGFSTALSLMANATIPVLAVKDGVPCSLNADPFKSLIADDLRETGELAAKFAVNWARSMSGVAIQHIHVHGLGRKEFETSVYSSLATMQVPLTPSLDLTSIYDELVKNLEQSLKARSKSLEGDVAKLQGSYQTALLTGPVTEKIAENAESFGASLIVFGRHNTIHRKPFGIGTVPYRAMLQQKAPILVVPTR